MSETPALYFACRSAIAAGSELDLGRGGFRTPLLSSEELKALRRDAARNGCQYVSGKTGVTVFRFGNAEPFRSPSKDLEEYTARVMAPNQASLRRSGWCLA